MPQDEDDVMDIADVLETAKCYAGKKDCSSKLQIAAFDATNKADLFGTNHPDTTEAAQTFQRLLAAHNAPSQTRM